MKRTAISLGLLIAGACLAAVIGCEIPLPPVPNPPPIVDPDVKPITGAAWVYVVEESADRTVELGLLIDDPWWHQQTFKCLKVDKDAEGIGDVIKAVGGTKLPAIVVTDASGKVVYSGELPRSIEAVKKLLGM